MDNPERPGLARTDRGVSRPLRAWLTRALGDAAALDELALAWSEHTLPERRQLASLLFRDISAEPVDSARAQALFATMSVLEDDRSLQEELLGKLRALEPVVAAFVYGDENDGGALLARERSPADWECLVVDWNAERATRVGYATVAADDSQQVPPNLRAAETSASPERAWSEVHPRLACERFALPLLRYTRRGGELPPEAERFASVVTRG